MNMRISLMNLQNSRTILQMSRPGENSRISLPLTGERKPIFAEKCCFFADSSVKTAGTSLYYPAKGAER